MKLVQYNWGSKEIRQPFLELGRFPIYKILGYHFKRGYSTGISEKITVTSISNGFRMLVAGVNMIPYRKRGQKWVGTLSRRWDYRLQIKGHPPLAMCSGYFEHHTGMRIRGNGAGVWDISIKQIHLGFSVTVEGDLTIYDSFPDYSLPTESVLKI